MSSTFQSFDHNKKEWKMSKYVNQMLEILKDMSKNISRMEARMKGLWVQMIEILDKQSNVILEIK